MQCCSNPQHISCMILSVHSNEHYVSMLCSLFEALSTHQYSTNCHNEAIGTSDKRKDGGYESEVSVTVCEALHCFMRSVAQ